ncbi:hypothetical protein RJ55_07600 [Drechmeria coniospora]|nr:hypothetical protein RJ55_07600 [Drechmeria coniospora]
MSLNGLDDPKVAEAFRAATSEPGWFLLKYATRDEVELLSSGSGGLGEMRNVVTEYDETSPLYGFLKYRRRNVIVKYLPEGCSRLIQARVAVHFNAICEQFSPYDAKLEISEAAELKDSKLSALCSLHAASCSTSSSTSSLRRRRLVEIAEEEEGGEGEEKRATKRQSIQKLGGDCPQSPADDTKGVDSVTLDSQLAESPENSRFSAGSTSELPTFVGMGNRPTSPATLSGLETSQLGYSSYPYSRPKIKLGPRPSLENGGRPQTAGNFRPVSAIPAGFKLFSRGSNKGHGRKDTLPAASLQEGSADLNFSLSTPTAPETLSRVERVGARPATSSGASTESPSMPPPATRKPIVSPEKARLIKAMQLREKKKKMSLQTPIASSTLSEPTTEAGEPGAEDIRDRATDLEEASPPANADCSSDAENGTAKVDSVMADRTPCLTQPDSRPPSPMVASSETEQSTTASSLSESTDDTVRAKNAETPLDHDNPELEPHHEDLVQTTMLQDKNSSEPIREETTAPSLVDRTEAGVELGLAVPESDLIVAAVRTEEREHGTILSDPSSSIVFESVAQEEYATQTTPCTDSCASETVNIDADDSQKFVPATSSEASTSAPPDTEIANESLESAASNSIQESPPADAKTTITAQDDQETPSEQEYVLGTKSLARDLPSPGKDLARPIGASQELSVIVETIPSLSSQDATEERQDEGATSVEPEIISAMMDQPKQRPIIEPIDTNPAHHGREDARSEANFSDDDELMDELQGAAVEEARPVLVGMTPSSATFPTAESKEELAELDASKPSISRTISNPVRGNLAVRNNQSTRSASTGTGHPEQSSKHLQPGSNLAKKSNIGSSISQRIKALEKLSAATGEPVASSTTRDRPSSAFFAVKKREPPKTASVMERANSLRNAPDLPFRSMESSQDTAKLTRPERSGSVTSRLSMFESSPGAAASGFSQRGRSEYVSVTAKIIRDPNQQIKAGYAPPTNPSEYRHLDLKQSPLLVGHRKPTPEPVPVDVDPGSERRSGSRERGKLTKSHPSLSIVKDFLKDRRKSVTPNQGDTFPGPALINTSRSPSRPPSANQAGAFSPRVSVSSHCSSVGKDVDIMVSPVQDSFGEDAKSANGDKKLSRAGRFMRRLSNLSGSRTKISPPGISPTVTEENMAEHMATRPATTGSPTIVSYVGDVNVQFPDNLLWKRRCMCLDSQGFLILGTLPAQRNRQAQGTKRYHLGEFRPPYIPDVEVQELPNSVVLDFIGGTSIQIACEDRAGQMNALNILQDAHLTRGATYGL